MAQTGLQRILLVHNAYQQRGGEDSVVDAEIELLQSHGHEVRRYTRTNDDVGGMSRAALLADTLWSRRSTRDLASEVAGFRPSVIHVHNTFPLISPSVYWAARDAGIPVVQTLHNFRLMCPQAMLLRNGRVCEDCVGHLPWRGVARACYRDSAAQSAVLCGMLGLHRTMGTYRKAVTRYIALNDFCRNKFIEGGLPADRISVKANFVDLPAPVEQARAGGIFVGRLSEEKGVAALADALAAVEGVALDIIGTGPLEQTIAGARGARMIGWQSGAQVYSRMARAAYLVMPSIWYENFPRTLVEAFACGTPVIASRLGALAELVRHGETGLLFAPGDAAGLGHALAWARDNPGEMARMGQNARQEFEQKYTPELNYRQLISIYAQAQAGSAS